MVNVLHRCLETAGDYAYHMVWGYELAATPENLSWALKQNKSDMFKYIFTTPMHFGLFRFNILEFAVRCEDLNAVHFLLDAGFSYTGRTENILSFYINWIREDKVPNLDILNLLINRSCQDNPQNRSSFLHIELEHALQHMCYYKDFHWAVVETLLEKGARIETTSHFGQTPFVALKNAHSSIIECEGRTKGYEKEVAFLEHLTKCAELERKYYDNSEIKLTLSEFKLYTRSIREVLSRFAVSTSSFISDAADSLPHDMHAYDIDPSDAVVDLCFSRKEFLKQKQLIGAFRDDVRGIQTQENFAATRAFILCRRHFQALVKEGSLKDCFEPWEWDSIEAPLLALWGNSTQKGES